MRWSTTSASSASATAGTPDVAARPGAIAQPVFMAHGTQDPVVPFRAGEQSAALLRGLGFDVSWHAYPMPHSVCAEEIRDLGDWMSKRFAASTA